MGTHISRNKSCTLDVWDETWISNFEKVDNETMNAY